MPEKTFQKTVPLFYFDNEGRTFEIAVRLKNTPGSLASLLAALAREEVNVINSTGYARDDYGVWVAFVQASKENLNVQSLETIALSSPSTLSVKVTHGVDGFLIDTLTFPLARIDGDRDIIIRAEFFRDMMAKLRREFHSAADVFLYKEGMALGERSTSYYLEKYGKDRILSSLSYYQSIYSALGWARAELVSADIEGRRAVLRLYESFECPKEKGDKVYSHFLRGFINGSFSQLVGVETSAKEVMCQAKNDPYCEFVVGQSNKI